MTASPYLRFCLGILFLLPLALQAQMDAHYSDSRKTTEGELLHASDSLHLLDSSLDDFHLYHPAFRNNFGILDLGNSGTAMYPVKYGYKTENGFDLGWHYLDGYRFRSNEENTYYRAYRPITSLFYYQGANELLGLEALHSQNIKPNWNFGVEYKRLKEEGFYLKQNTGSYNTRLFTWYHSKDYRYHVLASVTWNRFRNTENGGLYSAESFDTLSGPVRNPLTRYYSSFGEVENELKRNVYSVTQIYRLGQKRYFPTEATDSLGRPIPDTIPTFIPTHQVSVRTRLENYCNHFIVSDVSDMPFTDFFRDSLTTFDSTWYKNFETSIGIESGAYERLARDSIHPEGRKLFYGAWLDLNWIRVGWLEDYAQYANMALRAEVSNRDWISTREGFRVSVYRAFHGYNNRDMELKAEAARVLGPVKVGSRILFKTYRQDFLSRYYFGNHDFWYTNLERQGVSHYEFGISDPGPRNWWELNAAFIDLENLIYYGADQRPEQKKGHTTLLQSELKLKWRVAWFNLQSRVLYQKTNSRDILRVPELAMKHSLFAQGMVFKKNLKVKAGVDFFWTSAFNAPAWYAPARIWYTPEGEGSQTIGNYPYFNVFVNGQIRTVTFFLFFQHASAGLFSNSYYSSALYPMQPRSFRFGLRWKLYE